MTKPLRKYAFWALLGLPAACIASRYGLDVISYGQVVHETGLWSAGYLFAALAVTPIRRVFTGSLWPRKLLYHRRALGVASFGYAAFHTFVYTERKWGADLILKEAQGLDLLSGWAALLIFLLLAVTSNNASVRRLGKGWQLLHRSVYLAAGFMILHWVLASFDASLGYGFLAALLLIEALRFTRLRLSKTGPSPPRS